MDDWLVMAFDSTQQALRAEMLLEYAEVEIDLCPTPKEITAGCALSIQFPQESLGQVREIVIRETVEIRGIFSRVDGAYDNIGLEEETR
ncbi:uncharacterized protein DUF3343 [Fontibacillus phaseoli]|uniref:Uncharacterized protein DUF3343 n=1 Tax=Fontibacillus phaseoli TaxID=1416533 RepID=A0A369B2D9_9BACL|nr:DUF3343 domain-containing protein [Fontibacillus phaseoli]RCX15581.1 uncharacterized protein DUF3343 [Fontibacillus phaseoli]